MSLIRFVEEARSTMSLGKPYWNCCQEEKTHNLEPILNLFLKQLKEI